LPTARLAAGPRAARATRAARAPHEGALRASATPGMKGTLTR